MEPTTPATAALLQATIRQTAPAIPQADNLGVSNDPRDLFYLLDYLSFAVERAYPEIPCKDGCSFCCDTQVFRVSGLEWARVKVAIAEMAIDRQEALFAHNQALFGAQRETLEAIAAAWCAGDVADASLHNLSPRTCPLLVGGRCSVYHERPAICRGYGYFSATINDTPRLLICQQLGPGWIQELESKGIDQLPMPNWNPVQRQIDALERASGAGVLTIKPMPLWLLELAEERRGAVQG